MPTVAEYRQFFRTYNPSGGGKEEWNMECQAVVHRMAAWAAGVYQLTVYPTARAARLASGKLTLSMTNIPYGAVGYWLWGSDDHVAVWTPDGWVMGSRHISTAFGGVSRNVGTVGHAAFQSRAGLQFLGWSKTNGRNVVPVSTPAAPKPTATQRQVVAEGANRRVSPDGDARLLNVVAPNSIQEISGWRTGTTHEGTSDWFEVDGYGWASAAGFTSRSTAGLRDKNPAKPPVVVVPPVDSDPTPTPQPDPTEPDPIEPDPADPVEPLKPARTWWEIAIGWFIAVLKGGRG